MPDTLALLSWVRDGPEHSPTMAQLGIGPGAEEQFLDSRFSAKGSCGAACEVVMGHSYILMIGESGPEKSVNLLSATQHLGQHLQRRQKVADICQILAVLSVSWHYPAALSALPPRAQLWPCSHHKPSSR